MRIAAGLGFAILLSGFSAHAQTSYGVGGMEALRPGPATTICLADNGKNHEERDVLTVCKTTAVPPCPIDVRVRHGVGGALVAVDKNGAKREVIAPRLRLFLDDKRPDQASRRMVSARVSVHGSNGKARVLPLGANMGGNGDQAASDLERTLNVNLAQWGEPGVSGDFRLPGFTSTTRVDLLSVTYEDGNTWKLSGGETCRAVPDPMMLVGN